MAQKDAFPFIDLEAQRLRISDKIEEAVLRVIRHGKYIMGPEVSELEADLAKFTGVKHVIACSNGTDALLMPLMALGVGPGDAVFVPSFTFCATAEVVALAGAVPIFVDVSRKDFNVDVASLEEAIQSVQKEGKLTPKGIIAVDLFGLAADYDLIEKIAEKNNLWLMVDAAQGLGSTLNGKMSVSYGNVAGTSFFPAKPLGCYGDGGAIFTNDDHLAHILKSIRVHGQGTHRYDNVRIGMNGRLDTMQAAILIEKLRIFPDEIQRRQKIAERYNEALKDRFITPQWPPHKKSVWAQYTLILDESIQRESFCAKLQEKGIPTMVYYPKPLHHQEAYKDFPRVPSGLPVSEFLSQHVVSLPMHPYLDENAQDEIIEGVIGAIIP